MVLSGGFDLPLWPAFSRIQIGLFLVFGFAPKDLRLWNGHEMLHGVGERFVLDRMFHMQPFYQLTRLPFELGLL